MEWSKLTTFDRTLSLSKSGDLRVLQQDKKTSKAMAALLPSARRFNITDNSAMRIRDTITSYPEYLAKNGEFAIPPFETMWVEFNSRLMLHHEILTPYMQEDSDSRVGYLFHKNRVYTFSEADDLMPAKTDYEYILNRPMTFKNQKILSELFDVTRIGLDPFLWGHTLHEMLDLNDQRALRNTHDLEVSPYLLETFKMYPDEVKRIMATGYRGSAGELRNILAILLMINQPSASLKMAEVPRKRGMVKGRPMPYFGYSQVDINLDKSIHFNPNRKPTEKERTSLRWHEVRGHFCHNQKAKDKDHEHVWDEVEPRKWECALGCGAKRWWREYPDGKGSAELGYIHQHRRIKTSKDQRTSL